MAAPVPGTARGRPLDARCAKEVNRMPEVNAPVLMPVLALRGLTIFPNMLLHFDVEMCIRDRACAPWWAISTTRRPA